MIKVSELKNFPAEFLAILPKKCEICGKDTEITESLTILRCSNKKCPEKAVQRLVAMLKDLGVKNMGEAKCRKFMANFEVLNPYAIFMYEPGDGVLFDGASMAFSEQIFDQVDEKRKMLLWEYLKIGNLPGIRDSARHLLARYDDLEEFYDDVEDGGIAYVQSLLSIRGNGNLDSDDEDLPLSVKAVDVYANLMFFKDDLLEALEFVDIITVSTNVLNICISTAVGKPYKSKQDFVAQMNSKYGNKVHLNFLNSVTKDCNYLIWSKEGHSTNKVKKAEKYAIPIVTGDEFDGLLEKL